MILGKNKRAATLLLNNIGIYRNAGVPPVSGKDGFLLVDDFKSQNDLNALGLKTGVFNGPDGCMCSAVRTEGGLGKGPVVRLGYDLPRVGGFAGYWTTLANVDLNAFDFLRLSIRGNKTGVSSMFVGFEVPGGIAKKVPIPNFAKENTHDGEWQTIAVPLAAFKDALRNVTPGLVTIGFESSGGPIKGNMEIQDLRLFRDTGIPIIVDDFEHEGLLINHLGAPSCSIAAGAACSRIDFETNKPQEDHDRALMIAYGGSIGLDLGTQGFSFSGWETKLGGLDLSGCHLLEFRVRGSKGNENPNIYLQDGAVRRGLELKNYGNVTTSWTTVTIPLA